MKAVPLVIIGFRNEGRSFARLILEKAAVVQKRYDLDLKVMAIFEVEGVLFSGESLKIEDAITMPTSSLSNLSTWKSGEAQTPRKSLERDKKKTFPHEEN